MIASLVSSYLWTRGVADEVRLLTGMQRDAMDRIAVELGADRDRLAELTRKYEDDRADWNALRSSVDARAASFGSVIERVAVLESGIDVIRAQVSEATLRARSEADAATQAVARIESERVALQDLLEEAKGAGGALQLGAAEIHASLNALDEELRAQRTRISALEGTYSELLIAADSEAVRARYACFLTPGRSVLDFNDAILVALRDGREVSVPPWRPYSETGKPASFSELQRAGVLDDLEMFLVVAGGRNSDQFGWNDRPKLVVAGVTEGDLDRLYRDFIALAPHWKGTYLSP